MIIKIVDKLVIDELKTLEKLKSTINNKLVDCITKENEHASTVLSCGQCQSEIFIYFIKYEKNSFICLNCIEDLLIKQFP